MQPVLQFVKTHLISLLCAVGGIAFIALGALGMSSSTVIEQMNRRKTETSSSEISSLKNSSRNSAVIAAEFERGRRFDEEYRRTVQVLHEINQRQPLMEGVFPVAEKLATPVVFRERYAEALKVLPRKLIAGKLPDQAEIQEEVQNVRDLAAQEEEKRRESERPDQPPAGGRQPAAPSAPRTPRAGAEAYPPGETGAGGAPRAAGAGPGSEVAIPNEPRFNPVLRARVTKARSIRLYISPDTLHELPFVTEIRAPTSVEMWMAQVSFWVQQDVVNAIEKLHREFANRVRDGEVCVEHMPIKHLVRIDVRGYQTSKGLVPFPGRAGASGAEAAPPSFTGRVCDEQFDVVRFGVQAVVDQRQLLLVVDRVARENFYKCIDLDYQVVPEKFAQEGYLYGTAPVVLARMEFEGYLARPIYDKWMPREMRTLLGGQPDGQ